MQSSRRFRGFETVCEFHGTGDEIRVVVLAVAHIHVQRKIVGVILQIIEDGAVPADPVGTRAKVG